MSYSANRIKIFSGNSNRAVAQSVASALNLPLGKAEVTTFSDGEVSVFMQESVRGYDCFIIQSTSDPVNDNLMELLIMIDAMKRASAASITAVIPYLGYARQDRKSRARDPISAKLVADLITTAGANRVVTMDLHAQQIQGFFNIPVDHLIGAPLLASFLKCKISKNPKDYVVVSPDIGSVYRARRFAKKLNLSMAIVDKRRQKANSCEVMNIIGKVKGKKVIIVDDMIDTAGTLCKAAKALLDEGAKEVIACATHAILSGPAINRLKKSPINELVLMDTVCIPEKKMIDKITVLSVASVFAEAIGRIHEEIPVSPMFN